jgi:ectoine hydroxylase-related dioxygenase (phytanoyl-CoA dioxygenase family)
MNSSSAITPILVAALQEDGFAQPKQQLKPSEVRHLLLTIIDRSAELESGGRGGARDLAENVPEVRQLADHPVVREAAAGALGPHCRPVRTLWFDKTPTANWPVVWHQDLTIAVRGRIDVEGYGQWSVKDGVDHVQPPASVLEQMVAVRVHLDECGSDNGPLRVLPGTHVFGKLSPEQIKELRRQEQEVECLAPRGGSLVMRPLLLHASSRTENPRHRRVIHIEFAACELAGGLRWR